jgi:hypothetical protein
VADAPNLRAYWRARNFEHLVGVTRQAELNLSSLGPDDLPVPFDLRVTPIARVSQRSQILQAYAWRVREGVKLALFRDDPIDGPAERINQDQYLIVDRLESYSRFWAMLAPSSTQYNENMMDVSMEWTFVAKRRNNDGFVHHLPRVPSPAELIRFGR